MPFSENFLHAASREVEVKSIKNDFESVRSYIERALEKCAERTNGAFNPVDTEIYIHGSYANKTNTYFPSFLEIVIELKITPEYNPKTFVEAGIKSRKEKFQPGECRIYNNYFVDANLEFTPQIFRDLFFECLAEEVGTKASENNKTITFQGIGKLKHTIEITPCFSFEYKNETGDKFKGILLYDQSVKSNIVSFPRLHAKNGYAKDLATNGNFKKLVRLFKTLNIIYEREFATDGSGTASGYFIECLLYNVPNNLFINNRGESFGEVFLKVFNYLLQCDIDNFICQNQVWQLLIEQHTKYSIKEFWQKRYAKNFLHKMVRLYEIFPSSREFLA